jgi:hypothetical protein
MMKNNPFENPTVMLITENRTDLNDEVLILHEKNNPKYSPKSNWKRKLKKNRR